MDSLGRYAQGEEPAARLCRRRGTRTARCSSTPPASPSEKHVRGVGAASGVPLIKSGTEKVCRTHRHQPRTRALGRPRASLLEPHTGPAQAGVGFRASHGFPLPSEAVPSSSSRLWTASATGCAGGFRGPRSASGDIRWGLQDHL